MASRAKKKQQAMTPRKQVEALLEERKSELVQGALEIPQCREELRHALFAALDAADCAAKAQPLDEASRRFLYHACQAALILCQQRPNVALTWGFPAATEEIVYDLRRMVQDYHAAGYVPCHKIPPFRKLYPEQSEPLAWQNRKPWIPYAPPKERAVLYEFQRVAHGDISRPGRPEGSEGSGSFKTVRQAEIAIQDELNQRSRDDMPLSKDQVAFALGFSTSSGLDYWLGKIKADTGRTWGYMKRRARHAAGQESS